LNIFKKTWNNSEIEIEWSTVQNRAMFEIHDFVFKNRTTLFFKWKASLNRTYIPIGGKAIEAAMSSQVSLVGRY